MARWLWALIPVGVLGYILSFFGVSESLLFVLTALGLMPLAALIGKSTEELAYRVGPGPGGLLNASFGNVPEMVVGILALRDGLITLTQATIIGSVIGNAALVVGMSLFYGGLRNGVQHFSREIVSHHALLMLLAVASLALPSLYALTSPRGDTQTLSVVVACLLIVTYVAYMLYDLAGWRGGRTRSGSTFLEEAAKADEGTGEEEGPEWSVRLSLFWLGLATLLVALEGDVLVATVQPVTRSLGISEFFVGLVIIPIVGNVAEHFSAVQLAGRNKMDLSFAIASGSSIQVAVLVAPLLVLLSNLWHPMSLVFTPVEVVVLALVVAIFYFVAQDGESNWLEGLQLMMLYIMAAAVFFLVPTPAGL